MGIRPYLRLTRAHTSPLEAVPAAVGAMLATGGTVTMGVVYWTIFGLLYHLSGYGMNSFRDWKRGFDKDDPNKQHHPLNSGELTELRAEAVVTLLFSLTLVVAYGGAWKSGSRWLTISLVTVAVLCGVVYNELGKYTEHKYVFISVAHSLVFSVPYVAMGGKSSMVLLFGTLTVFMWVVYQISISGEIKDIAQDGEANILRSLGAEVVRVNPYKDSATYYIKTDRTIQFIGAGQRWVMMVCCGFFAYYASPTALSIQLAMVIGLLTMVFSLKLLRSGPYDREDRIREMSIMEIGSMSMFVVAALGVVSPLGVVTILVGSGVWLASLNLVEWGTFISPEV